MVSAIRAISIHYTGYSTQGRRRKHKKFGGRRFPGALFERKGHLKNFSRKCGRPGGGSHHYLRKHKKIFRTYHIFFRK